MNTSLPFKIQFPALPLGVSITTTLPLNIVLLQVEAKDVNDLFAELGRSSVVQCGFGCAFKHSTSQDYNAELTKCKAETTSACYKCVDECAKAKSGAVAVTSITFLFSVVIASLVV